MQIVGCTLEYGKSALEQYDEVENVWTESKVMSKHAGG